MKKHHILLLLLAALLLLSAVACQGTPPEAPSNGDAGAPPLEGPTDGTIPTTPDDYLDQNGYPMGFSITLVGENGYGLDTARSCVFYGSAEAPCEFSASTLASLYYEMTEHDIYAICEAGGDLTYKTISGDEPAGENETYYLTFTEGDVTHSVKTDKAAWEAYADRPDVSNLASLIKSFSGFARSHC